VSEAVRIRPFRPGDEPALMEVCRRTADAGGDSSYLFSERDLVGTIWCMPYLVLEPDLASVVASADEPPVGYVLGALDSTAFHHAAEDRYWPSARARFPLDAVERGSLDELLVHLIHDRSNALESPELLASFPSHLHIDLLPEVQGRGLGRELIDRLSAQLAERGSPGVHLGVSRANERAIAFYRHLGFVEWDEPGDGINLVFVRDLSLG